MGRGPAESKELSRTQRNIPVRLLRAEGREDRAAAAAQCQGETPWASPAAQVGRGQWAFVMELCFLGQLISIYCANSI